MSTEETFIAIRNDIHSLRRFPLSALRLIRIRSNFSSLHKADSASDYLKAAWWELRKLSIDIHNDEKIRFLTTGTIWHLHNTLFKFCSDTDQAEKLKEDLATLKTTAKPIMWDLNVMWIGILVFFLWSFSPHYENLSLRASAPYPGDLIIKTSNNKNLTNEYARGAFIKSAGNVEHPSLDELRQLVTTSKKQITLDIQKDGAASTINLPISEKDGTKKLELTFFPTADYSIKRLILGGLMFAITLLLLFPLNSSLGFLNGPITIFINVMVLAYYSSTIQSSISAMGLLAVLFSSYYLFSNRWVFTGVKIDTDNQEASS